MTTSPTPSFSIAAAGLKARPAPRSQPAQASADELLKLGGMRLPRYHLASLANTLDDRFSIQCTHEGWEGVRDRMTKTIECYRLQEPASASALAVEQSAL